MRKATVQQIRQAYKTDGYEARIHKDGLVEFRSKKDNVWLHGRYVENYRYHDELGNVVLL